MFYLFILDSIGTSELILIGLVALIIFGPRKLPEFAKMLGKARNEFKRTTDEFKQTWEREVDFESVEKNISETNAALGNNSVQKSDAFARSEIVAPEIREVSEADFQDNYSEKKTVISGQSSTESAMSKRDWL